MTQILAYKIADGRVFESQSVAEAAEASAFTMKLCDSDITIAQSDTKIIMQFMAKYQDALREYFRTPITPYHQPTETESPHGHPHLENPLDPV